MSVRAEELERHQHPRTVGEEVQNGPMALTIDDILEHPALRTRLLAGAAGSGRTVHWAHASDEQRPWDWLGPGELLMTTGRHLPADGGGQADFIRRLAQFNLAGVTVAERMGAPPLTDQMLRTADELDFPLLQTAYEVPWVLISRTVAEATSRTGQLSRIMRVYETFRRASLEGLSDEAVLEHLEHELGASLTVLDVSTGAALLPVNRDVMVEVWQKVVDLARAGTLPGLARVTDGNLTHLILPLYAPTEVVVATTTTTTDLVVLQHAAAMVSVIATRLRTQLEGQLAQGTVVLRQISSGELDADALRSRMSLFSLTSGPWQVLAVDRAGSYAAETLTRLREREIPVLVATSREELIVLTSTAHTDEIIEVLTTEGVPGGIGVSDVASTPARLPDTIREARWAAEAADQATSHVAHYGQDWPLFLPRTLSEASYVVDRVLGELLAYDEEKNTEMVHSLEVWFANNRSWEEARKALFIHKQTLVYRIRRVGEITGRDLDDLTDVSELHLALRCMHLLEKNG